MKSLLCMLALAVLTISPGYSQERYSQEKSSSKRTWLRRLTLAGACAASFLDVRSTQSAVANGAVEANPLFAGRAGNPRYGRMIGFKLGACAGMGIAQELGLFGRGKSADHGWIAANTTMAGTFAAIVARNKAIQASAK